MLNWRSTLLTAPWSLLPKSLWTIRTTEFQCAQVQAKIYLVLNLWFNLIFFFFLPPFLSGLLEEDSEANQEVCYWWRGGERDHLQDHQGRREEGWGDEIPEVCGWLGLSSGHAFCSRFCISSPSGQAEWDICASPVPIAHPQRMRICLRSLWTRATNCSFLGSEWRLYSDKWPFGCCFYHTYYFRNSGL